ncbi:hypothetical protein [Robertmurraya sp.]|uniref:hypothetical protein n=1 Tax=Robertmurraya sp. TaxID=2837525 RepID=UPI0037048A45
MSDENNQRLDIFKKSTAISNALRDFRINPVNHVPVIPQSNMQEMIDKIDKANQAKWKKEFEKEQRDRETLAAIREQNELLKNFPAGTTYNTNNNIVNSQLESFQQNIGGNNVNQQINTQTGLNPNELIELISSLKEVFSFLPEKDQSVANLMVEEFEQEVQQDNPKPSTLLAFSTYLYCKVMDMIENPGRALTSAEGTLTQVFSIKDKLKEIMASLQNFIG